MSESAEPVGVLFVCLGNICRSPLAEAVFAGKAAERGCADRFRVDSAGTGGWHVGEPPDPRAREVAARSGVELSGRARQVTPADWRRFDHLICMDESNRRELLRLGAPRDKVRLLLESLPDAERREVPDPYYGGSGGFNTVYELVDAACAALLDELLAVSR